MAQEIADSTLLDTWASGGNIVEPDISKTIEGWQLGEQPPHEYMNWLQNTFGSKLNHILKNGVASWNNETEYLAGSSVQHNSNVWLCKTTNTNSEPTDANAKWKRIITVESLTTVLGGYVTLTENQTIGGTKTFSLNPLSTAAQSPNSNALTKYSAVVKNTGNETIAGVKTFSSSPIVPTPTTGTQAVNKAYVDSKPTLPTGTILNGYTIFDNCIVAFGGEFNRADYPKLWAYLQANPTLVKTQAEWTTENTTNGMCGFFSDGNGTTTFRVPNLDKAFLRPDSRIVGSYQEGSYATGDPDSASPVVTTLMNYDNNASALRSRMNWDNITTVSTGATNLMSAYVPTGSSVNYQVSPDAFGVTRPKNIAVLPLIVAK